MGGAISILPCRVCQPATAPLGPLLRRIDALVARHINESAIHEWPAMASHRATISSVPAALGEALRLTLAEVSKTEEKTIRQRELVRSLEEALDARRQRIIISQLSINWVKWSTLPLQALLLLVTVGMVHCEHRDTAAIAMGIFATAVATSALLIAAHARPFTGQISVKPDVLWQVMAPMGPRVRP